MRKFVSVDSVWLFCVTILLVSVSSLHAKDEKSSSTPAGELTVNQGETQNNAATVKEIWSEVLAKRGGLDKLQSENKLNASAKHLAGGISVLVRRLPEQSEGLSAEQISRLKKAIEGVERSTREVAKAVDVNDLTACATGVKKLEAELDLIASLYPPGTLPQKASIPPAAAVNTAKTQR